ncbi:hypothetical protein MPQ_2306 [Methylovorus sp. MP688]|nr:hypothetical protein MPQ_2306 [Methylovorus sp. MP688]
MTSNVLGLNWLVSHTYVVQWDVHQTSTWRVSHWLLVLNTQSCWADALGIVVLVSRSLSILMRNAGLQVNVGSPVDEGVSFFSNQQGAVNSVKCVVETVTVSVECVLLATLFEQNNFVDAVIIPLIVRSHLITPLSDTGVQIASENSHGPLVVTRTYVWVPNRWVTSTVVHQVQLRIIWPPAPYGTAAVFPAVFNSLWLQPGLNAQVFFRELQLVFGQSLERTAFFVTTVHVLVYRQSAVVWVSAVEISTNQHFAVRTSGVGLPCQGAVFQVVSSDKAANTEFSTGATGQNLVLDNVRSVGVSSTDLRISVLNIPNLGASLSVKSNQHAVILLQEDLAVAEAQTAAYVIAAQNSLYGWVLLREVRPDDLLVVVQVQSVNVVWECSVNVHHTVNHQWGAFVTTVNTGSECPGSLQVLNVTLVDLIQGAVCIVVVLTAWVCPVVWVGHRSLLVCSSRSNHRKSHAHTDCHAQSQFNLAHLHFKSP